MGSVDPGRPEHTEYPLYFEDYINLVPDGDIATTLERQIGEFEETLAAFSAAQAQRRPAPGEWNVIEVVGHVADIERAFAYRALTFARNNPGPLPGIDPDGFMLDAGFAQRSLADVVAELVTVRRASVALLRSFDEAAWSRQGVADGKVITVRALTYAMAGHERHHALDFPKYGALEK